MKKGKFINKKICMGLLALLLAVGVFANSRQVEASYPLDHIHDYQVQVDVRDDGSCDIKYHIEWEVLDSTSDGPLTWIKVGIANKYADEFKALSDNIKEIRYYKDEGDYARLDLDRKYEAGETLQLDFSLHQKNLFTMDGDVTTYIFTPGWFEDTPVDRIEIRWNAENALGANKSAELKNGYYVWVNEEGGYDVRQTVKIKYSSDQYDYKAGNEYLSQEQLEEDANRLYTGDEMTLWSVLMIVFPGLAIVVAIIWAMKDKDIRDDGYDKKRGLGAGYYSALEDGRTHRGGRIVHGRGGSGGSGCACACACACAGGGRAGCSRKDFYGTKLYTKAIYTALEKESE